MSVPSRTSQDIPPTAAALSRADYLAEIHHRPWSNPEISKLRKEVKAQNSRAVAMRAQMAGEDIAEALEAVEADWFEENTEGLDWEKIAQVVSQSSSLLLYGRS